MEEVDRKYRIQAINPCTGNLHNELDSVLFLAKDRAFLEGALPGYLQKSIELGATPTHIASIKTLIKRVAKYQEKISKVSDTDSPCEVRRCIGCKESKASKKEK